MAEGGLPQNYQEEENSLSHRDANRFQASPVDLSLSTPQPTIPIRDKATPSPELVPPLDLAEGPLIERPIRQEQFNKKKHLCPFCDASFDR